MEPALAIFATLLGHCWEAQITPRDVDTHCFTDMWSGVHVRDRHVVAHDGKSVYEGETIYSFDGKQIVFTYVNSTGGVGTGTARVQDKAIAFSGSMRAQPRSAPQPIDSSWKLVQDGYDVVNAGGTDPIRFRPAR
jgi:hypothetical protein